MPRAAHAAPGSVVFAADGALYKLPVGGPNKNPELIAPIPDYIGSIRRLSAAVDGSSVLVQGTQYAVWIDLTGLSGAEPPLDCPKGSRLDNGGTWVICDGADGRPSFHHMRSPRQTLSLGYEAGSATRVADGNGIVFSRDDSLWGLHLGFGGTAGAWKDRFRLAPAPTGFLLIAPNGRRAIGRFTQNGHAGLFSFALDGRGALRKLDGPYAEPIGWSADSRWVLIQDVKRSCAALASGWRI